MPDEIWSAAIPKSMHGRVVCLSCFTRLADEAGLRWDEQITFWPVSLIASQELEHLLAANEL